MPARSTRIPSYRHYRPKDLAVVRIDGHDHYLGKYDSPESRERYHRLIAEWFAPRAPSPAAPPGHIPRPPRGGDLECAPAVHRQPTGPRLLAACRGSLSGGRRQADPGTR